MRCVSRGSGFRWWDRPQRPWTLFTSLLQSTHLPWHPQILSAPSKLRPRHLSQLLRHFLLVLTLFWLLQLVFLQPVSFPHRRGYAEPGFVDFTPELRSSQQLCPLNQWLPLTCLPSTSWCFEATATLSQRPCAVLRSSRRSSEAEGLHLRWATSSPVRQKQGHTLQQQATDTLRAFESNGDGARSRFPASPLGLWPERLPTLRVGPWSSRFDRRSGSFHPCIPRDEAKWRSPHGPPRIGAISRSAGRRHFCWTFRACRPFNQGGSSCWHAGRARPLWKPRGTRRAASHSFVGGFYRRDDQAYEGRGGSRRLGGHRIFRDARRHGGSSTNGGCRESLSLGQGRRRGFRENPILLSRRCPRDSALKCCPKKAATASSSSRWNYRRRGRCRGSTKEDAYGEPAGRILGCPDYSAACDQREVAGAFRAHVSYRECGRGSFCDSARKTVSLEKALVFLDYAWIRSCLQPCPTTEGDATTSKFINPCEARQSDVFSGGGGRDFFRFPPGAFRFWEGDARTDSGLDTSGVSACGQFERPYAGFGIQQQLPVKSRGLGPGEVTERVGVTQGDFLPHCHAANGAPDESSAAIGCGAFRAEAERGDTIAVSGEVWRIWSQQRSGVHHMAGGPLYEPHAGEQSSCSDGCSQPSLRVLGAGGDGWGESPSGAPPFFDGGPSPELVHREVLSSWSATATFCADGKSEMDHNSFAVPERNGCDLDTKKRDHRKQSHSRSNSRSQQHSTSSKYNTKEEGKGQGRRERQSKHPDSTAGGGRAVSQDEERLEEEISFQRILSCLPRWISRSRTKFSSFLSRTFHIRRAGSCPLSAIFPVPIPHVGLFDKQALPKLSVRSWRRLCFKRALHVLVIALNYIHGGMRPVPLALLGRRPTSVHLDIYRRLRSLLIACDRPDSHPMPPGRSGPELLARLIELEHFASSHASLNPDPYSGSLENGPLPLEQVGNITEEHKFCVSEEFSSIRPYRGLIASRLKITGGGDWPMADFIQGPLWLPFKEPAILRHDLPVTWPGPDFSREDRDQNLKLAKIWDSRGLLALFHENPSASLSCRVFNAHKNALVDRQIGDRRWMNGAERHPRGPSAFLPSGANVTAIHCPTAFKLVGCASDRKDFYHQAEVTRERAATNMLPFKFHAWEFEGSSALDELKQSLRARKTREEAGDRYGFQRRPILSPSNISEVYAGFKSLFQGDHLGVEYALDSHCNLLKQHGLLSEGSQVLRHKPFPTGPLWEGVVIDDYFAVSRERAKADNLRSKAVECLEIAEGAYAAHKVLGSDEKTVRGEESFKIIGAEVLADQQARDVGLVAISAPASKRLPMICISLKLASMRIISRALASRVAGNWISIFMFRRSLCCLMSEIFQFGVRSAADENEVLEQPRRLAEELVLASIFGLVAVSDVSVPYDRQVYATDASLCKGTFTALTTSHSVAECLWLGGDRRGAYTLLDNPARQQLRGLGIDVDAHEVAEDFRSPSRSLDFSFDAVEICGGSGVLSKALAAEGLSVCPPIDLSYSKHYDLRDLRLLEWIFDMIIGGRFEAVIVEPVCTTFSPAQHPSSRSYDQPTGFDREDPKTFLGNLIAFRCLAIMWVAFRQNIVALLEQPHLSNMAWLSAWRFLLSLGLEEAVVNSCAFGSPHKKAFRLLGWNLPMRSIATKCPGGHQHVRIEGSLTKQSAVYHPGLAAFLAQHIAAAVRKRKHSDEQTAPRLESVVINDILSQPGWETLQEWTWQKTAHINILESRSLVSLCRHLTLEGGDRRFSALLDSRVAKGAHAKGRSSAHGLRPSLLRACAYHIAGNLHPSYGFSPTRLNTADAPTRDRPLPEPSVLSILDFLSETEIAALHSHQFSRATAGWIRLFLLLVICPCPGEGCWTCESLSSSLNGFWIFHPDWIWICALLPICLALISSISGIGFHCRLGAPRRFWFYLIFLVSLKSGSHVASAMPLQPSGAGDAQRAARRAGVTLQADRVVLQQTRDRRDVLLADFDAWLSENMRTTVEDLICSGTLDCEVVSEALVAYGKQMYHAGRSYNKFSETINAVTARRPALRRNLGSAWDLAFNWVVDEPHEHHRAMPLSIMLATITLSLLWGWSREAALLALAWTGVLRIGDVFSARRADLVLPSDAAPGVDSVLLKVRLPKTRGRAARHQSSRIDPVDVVCLLSTVFSNLNPDEALWPYSPATLRRKFALLQTALGLTEGPQNQQIYTLSSLRPGGATFWLFSTEDAEYVRRKGRWTSTRVLEIYLQETSYVTFTSRISPESRSRIEDLCKQFPNILSKVQFFKSTGIPERVWPQLWWCGVLGKVPAQTLQLGLYRP